MMMCAMPSTTLAASRTSSMVIQDSIPSAVWMSLVGHKGGRKRCDERSGLPVTADVRETSSFFSSGPRTDSCTAANRIAIQSVRGAGVALLGSLALTVAQNLGIAAERIHDCGKDEFDAR